MFRKQKVGKLQKWARETKGEVNSLLPSALLLPTFDYSTFSIKFSQFYVVSFLKGYLITVLVEFLVLCPYARQTRRSTIFFAVLLLNSLSLPVVWFVIPFLINRYFEYLIVAEFFAVLSETVLLKVLLRFSYTRAAAASLTMNMASFVIGLTYQF